MKKISNRKLEKRKEKKRKERKGKEKKRKEKKRKQKKRKEKKRRENYFLRQLLLTWVIYISKCCFLSYFFMIICYISVSALI